MNFKQSFPPLECADARILILGSIPGDMSLKLQEYYGHSQNRFWRMIATITGCEAATDYDTKKALLATNHIALWDVAHSAIRKGSMDSAIRDEEPNSINDYLANHPTIHTVAFNGKKAEQLFDKFFVRLAHIKYLSMPSTSPANAACKFDELCRRWSELLDNSQ